LVHPQISLSGKASGSFLKKRTKKLLLTAGFGDVGATTRRRKVFLLLFVHKKKALLAFAKTSLRRRPAMRPFSHA
jgi:hypothetical protein